MEIKYPMIMTPVFKDYLWGGERLATEYGKKTSLRPIAESWEVSCHPDGLSLISNGALAGRTLSEVLKKNPGMMGEKCRGSSEFPILIKLLDAEQDLSVQVHPPDEYAYIAEGQQGKNEMWYVLDCTEGASLILGFKNPMPVGDFKKKLMEKSALEALNKVYIRPGDCFCVPAGMIHAIGKGALIAEIQQSSNVTYRVYDYNRKDADGKSRPLHLDKALDIIDTRLKAENMSKNPRHIINNGYSTLDLAVWKYFKAECLYISSRAELMCDRTSFHCLVVYESGFELIWSNQRVIIGKGESAFIPSGFGEYTIFGHGKILLIHM